MEKPMFEPALTAGSSAVLLIDSEGHWTVVVALAVTVGWFVAVRVAVFGYAWQLANEVLLTMCTEKLAPDARLTAVQCSVWEPTAPVIEQFAGPLRIDQFTPEPAGSGSSRT